MSNRYCVALSIVAAVGCAVVAAAPAISQEAKEVQRPGWSHAFDLKCRRSTEPKFTKDTRSFGLEVFRDENNGKGLYIIEDGDIGAVPDLKGSSAKSRDPEWLLGLDLKVRPAGELSFARAKVFGVEVFRDEKIGNLVYITEVGSFSVAQGGRGVRVPEVPKAPRWVHGIDLKVRHAGEKDTTKDTKVWSIEVYVDDNTGNLVYICENGKLAIVPGFQDAPSPTPKTKEPVWLHRLDLKVRKGGQKDFDGETKVFRLEVFRDENNGNLIFISETGSLSVVADKKDLKAPTDEATIKQPDWLHGLDLKCRRFGQSDFTKDTPLYGVEVFNDNNTGCTIYICQTGAIAAVPK